LGTVQFYQKRWNRSLSRLFYFLKLFFFARYLVVFIAQSTAATGSRPASRPASLSSSWDRLYMRPSPPSPPKAPLPPRMAATHPPPPPLRGLPPPPSSSGPAPMGQKAASPLARGSGGPKPIDRQLLARAAAILLVREGQKKFQRPMLTTHRQSTGIFIKKKKLKK
jgi:hypothetical protein